MWVIVFDTRYIRRRSIQLWVAKRTKTQSTVKGVQITQLCNTSTHKSVIHYEISEYAARRKRKLHAPLLRAPAGGNSKMCAAVVVLTPWSHTLKVNLGTTTSLMLMLMCAMRVSA